MRILSWNINGIRTLPKYHPWNTFKTCEGILDELKADVICFQEMKSSRATLPRDVAVPGHFHAFFSFPVTKGGYSGVGVFTDSRTVIPLKAEEGLSGKLQPQPPLSAEERISPSYPYPHDITAYPDEQGDVPATFDALDGEGRALVLDFGLFVLINVYCPNETSDSRLSFKMNYHLMLQERVRKLIEEEHREVIVLGDINICSTPLDHCDGHLPSNQATFYDHPARAWFRNWQSPNGPMIDVVRTFWPDRKGLYTCWNMRIQARETNYGTRVDYILVTKGLLPWIQHGDIQPSLKGSDHCPIYIDLRDEITLESGETIKLRDAMKQTDGPRDPPRISAKFWPEFSGKQTNLAAFFGKPGAASKESGGSGQPALTPPRSAPKAITTSSSGDAVREQSESARSTQPPERLAPPAKEKTKSMQASKPPPAPPPSKRKSSESSSNSAKKRKQVKGQASIAAFFSKPSAAASSSTSASKTSEVIEVEDDDAPTACTSTSGDAPCPSQADQDQLDADYRLALELSKADGEASIADDEPSPSPSSSSQNHAQKKAAWSELFTPVQPPNCLVHGEPTKMYTVNKPGPNKGKKFFLCSRPVGPGYDKGKGERLRDEVDHQYRCNFFKWASEVRKEALRERERERTRTSSQGR
ncbi:DNase I-like protein [Trametes cingulata]|nr:DNase I-like protein [Trametes cingulata]